MSSRTHWDVIVIGAGLAGLSCAAHLAKAGKEVVVLEQRSRPGGYWTSFSRQGLIFDISTHRVSDPQAINRVLQDLGAPPVDFVQLDNLGRYVGPPVSRGHAGRAGSPQPPTAAAATPAWDITVSPDVEAFKRSVRTSFPTVSEKALAKLTTTAIWISRRLDSQPVCSPELASSITRLTAASAALRNGAGLRRLSLMPAEKYFRRLFPGDNLAGLRAALHSMAPAPDMPAVGALAVLGTGLRGRVYAPRGGAQSLSDAFADAAERNGAEIRCSAGVATILAGKRDIQGVILDDRTELWAPIVVSAVDARQTFYRLLHRDRIPDSYRRVLDNGAVSQPYAMVSAVTTLEPASYGFDDTDVVVCPSLAAPLGPEAANPAGCPFRLSFPQHYEPGADRSRRAVQIVALSSYSWHEHWETRPTPERGPEYQALKEEWGRTIIDRAQDYLPRLSSHLETMDVSTPITMYRRTLNTDGAPFGWHHSNRRRWRQQVPFLKGLYQAGHWVSEPGALEVIRSGGWAAELVLRHSPSPKRSPAPRPAAPPSAILPKIDLAG